MTFTKIENLGNLTLGHINAQLHDKNANKTVKYDYFGKRVSRGIVNLDTKIGMLTIEFREENGYAQGVVR